MYIMTDIRNLTLCISWPICQNRFKRLGCCSTRLVDGEEAVGNRSWQWIEFEFGNDCNSVFQRSLFSHVQIFSYGCCNCCSLGQTFSYVEPVWFFVYSSKSVDSCCFQHGIDYTYVDEFQVQGYEPLFTPEFCPELSCGAYVQILHVSDCICGFWRLIWLCTYMCLDCIYLYMFASHILYSIEMEVLTFTDWILKMRFLWKWLVKSDLYFKNANFVKNWLLKCDFCEKWDFENAIFVKNGILKMWILLKMRFWKFELL